MTILRAIKKNDDSLVMSDCKSLVKLINNHSYFKHALQHWKADWRQVKSWNACCESTLMSFPWGDTNFHLIKVSDVSWDTKPHKLIYKSIPYYHKLLSERRLQPDPRQSVLWCASSHSDIGHISIVTDSFSVLLSLPPTSTKNRMAPVLVAVGESGYIDLGGLVP